MRGKKGRPTYVIDADRLKGIRHEKGFTQQQVATELNQFFGGTPESMLTGYQRVEKTGKTSRKRAEALAQILGVTVHMLTGEKSPEPSSYLSKIEALVRTKLSEKNNAALQKKLDEYESMPDPITSIAEDVGAMIEEVQLGRNPTAISELVEYLGVPESELLAPAYYQGHWLLMTNLGDTKILRGGHSVFREIQEMSQEKRIPFLSHDAFAPVIRMWRDGYWFRTEVEPGRGAPKTRIDFVRCQPKEKGLDWGRASWQDEHGISEHLKRWAYSVANSVKDFKGIVLPQNLDGLRLVVSQRMSTSHPHQDCSSLKQAVISAPELCDEMKERLALSGEIHAAYQNRLSKELHRVLMPCLAKYPAEMWNISIEGGLEIRLDRSASRNGEFPESLSYQISLVEEVSSNKHVRVPWCTQDRTRFMEQIQDWLKDIGSYADSENAHRQFEMIESIVRIGPSLRLTPYV